MWEIYTLVYTDIWLISREINAISEYSLLICTGREKCCHYQVKFDRMDRVIYVCVESRTLCAPEYRIVSSIAWERLLRETLNAGLFQKWTKRWAIIIVCV